MPVHLGTNNFLSFQNQHRKEICGKIAFFLKKAKSGGVVFDNFNEAAKYLSIEIHKELLSIWDVDKAVEKPQKIAISTFYRNKSYRSIIELYFRSADLNDLEDHLDSSPTHSATSNYSPATNNLITELDQTSEILYRILNISKSQIKIENGAIVNCLDDSIVADATLTTPFIE